MKKFKLSVLCAAMMMVLGFTSCLDSDNSGTRGGYGAEFVKVENFMGSRTLINEYGSRMRPVNASQVTSWPTTEFSYVVYSFESEALADTASTIMDVTLMQLAQVNDGQVQARVPAEGDANAPVAGFATDDGSVAFFQLNDMFLSFYCFIRNVDSDESIAELNKHQFSLYYDPETDFTASSLKFYLRHKVTDLEEDDTFNRSTGVLVHFNMAAAFAQYKQMFDKEPGRIIISYEQNTANGSYSDNMVSERTYEFDYDDLQDIKNYKQWLEQYGK